MEFCKSSASAGGAEAPIPLWRMCPYGPAAICCITTKLLQGRSLHASRPVLYFFALSTINISDGLKKSQRLRSVRPVIKCMCDCGVFENVLQPPSTKRRVDLQPPKAQLGVKDAGVRQAHANVRNFYRFDPPSFKIHAYLVD